MKHSHKLALVLLTLFLCGAPGCPHQKWHGPSSQYKALDGMEVKDRKVWRSEWEAMYGACLKQRQAACSWAFAEHMARFSCMDQDRSGYVTWSEYYDVQFVHEVSCPLYHQLIRTRPSFDQEGNIRIADASTAPAPGPAAYPKRTPFINTPRVIIFVVPERVPR